MSLLFARKAIRLINPEIELVPDVFKEKFFDSSDEVASHAAIGAKVTGAIGDPWVYFVDPIFNSHNYRGLSQLARRRLRKR